MKNTYLKFLLVTILIVGTFAASRISAQEAPAPGVVLSGTTQVENNVHYLLAQIGVRDVSQLISARVDVEYDVDSLELVSVLDDVDMSKMGRQNFLGTSILSTSEIKEAGVSEYGVAKIWPDGVAPAGSSGTGVVGLLVFEILAEGETTLKVRKKTLALKKNENEMIPEFGDGFEIVNLTIDTTEN